MSKVGYGFTSLILAVLFFLLFGLLPQSRDHNDRKSYDWLFLTYGIIFTLTMFGVAAT